MTGWAYRLILCALLAVAIGCSRDRPARGPAGGGAVAVRVVEARPGNDGCAVKAVIENHTGADVHVDRDAFFLWVPPRRGSPGGWKQNDRQRGRDSFDLSPDEHQRVALEYRGILPQDCGQPAWLVLRGTPETRPDPRAAQPAQSAQTAAPVVAVEVRSPDDASFRKMDGAALQRLVVARMVEDGFAVVAPPREAPVTVIVGLGRDTVDLDARGPGGELHRRVVATNVPLAELHLELAQKSASLARGVAGEPR